MDLQKPFNVHGRLIRSQDSRLQQKFKLLKDSGLFLKTYPGIMQTITIVCDTQDHSDDQTS
jgi:hypothetical protein